MFLINLQGKTSIYEQIRDQITRFINLGILNVDDKLPSVRQLAQELGINPNTVQKAYQELEAQGYIYTMPKKGAFVANKNIDARLEIKKEVKTIMQKAKNEGLKLEEIEDIIKDVYGGSTC